MQQLTISTPHWLGILRSQRLSSSTMSSGTDGQVASEKVLSTFMKSDEDASSTHRHLPRNPMQETTPQQNKRSPSDFLKAVLGRSVVVRLNSGTDYKGGKTGEARAASIDSKYSASPLLLGVLACLDGYMNIAMEQTEEYVDGQLKSKYGDCFIRGNNGTCLQSH